MFYGQILTIFGIIPLIGWIAAIAGMVLFLVGLHEAAGADEATAPHSMWRSQCWP